MKYIKKLLIFIILLMFPFLVNAASSTVKITSSTTKPIIGNTFKVTVKVSSSVSLGSVSYTLSYDTSKLKCTSEKSEAWVAKNGSTKSFTKTFTFKAIASGSSKVTVKSYEAYAYSNEAYLKPSISPITISPISKAALEASYSTNNYLSSLNINPGSLSPKFDKSVETYHVTLEPNIEKITISGKKAESHASISGLGTFKVSEGDNKFKIVVTSQKGTTRTYTIIATVVDKNPIKITVNNKEYTLIKKDSMLKELDTFKAGTVTINDQTIPSLYSEITGFNLVGLKDEEGDISLAIYNEKNNSYTLYDELKFDTITLFPTKFDKPFKNYLKKEITINDTIVEGYKYKDNSDFIVIRGINIETGETNTYIYDQKEETLQRYNDETEKEIEDKLKGKDFLVLVLGLGLILELFLIIIFIGNNISKAKKRKKEKLEETKKEKH